MLHKLRSRAGEEGGFTLIELLVVILIIGILAAIAIPSFLNQREKANDANAKADARTAQTAMETFYTDNQTYGATANQLRTIESQLPSDAEGFKVAGDADSFTVITRSTGENNVEYAIHRNSSGAVSRHCGTDAQTAAANSAPAYTAGASTGGCNTSNAW